MLEINADSCTREDFCRREKRVTKTDPTHFFSVPEHLIVQNDTLPYDIYINSSKREGKDRFVKIFPMGETLDTDYLGRLKKKYFQLYIPEIHRSRYLKSIMKTVSIEDLEKVDIIKDSAITYLDRLFDGSKEMNTEVLEETLNGCHDAVEGMVDVLQDYDIEGLKGLIGDLSFHDFYTYDHSINVAMYCIAIYKAMKPEATQGEQTQVGLGGLLHDLGKTKISTAIINKVGKLTEEEFGEIKKHPGFGLEMLHESDMNCPGIDFEVLGRVINEHHENWDGTGYPNKLAENDIHLHARICAIADFFDAVTTKRSYADVLSTQEAVNIMSKTVGKKLDPFIFKIFQRVVKKFVKKDQITHQMDPNFDSEREYDELPLIPVPKEVEEAKTSRVQFMDHKNKPERPKEMPKLGGNANDLFKSDKSIADEARKKKVS